ncbi:MAG: DUF2284 domain-containing protein [Methanosarcinaceae archaeon]|nr:DUF2284 domain-containing protein [Methanosarcinaceae archaeon]
MTNVSDESQLEKLVTLALQHGATMAIIIQASDIVVDERVRLKCMVPRCNHYGDLVCPPNTLELDEFRKILSRYSFGVMLATEYKYPPKPASLQESDEAMSDIGKKAKELSEILLKLEGEALNMGYRFVAGLTGGECMFCEKCVGTGGKCKHPFNARPSMEAMGIDVIATLENVGKNLEFPVKDKVQWWGLLLVY